MDLSTMSFGELLYHGRYHFILALLFLVFLGGFVIEIVRAMRARHSETVKDNGAFDLVFQDAVMGATMMDGGEPIESGKEKPDQPER